MEENWKETGYNFDLNLNTDQYFLLEHHQRMFAHFIFDGEDVVGYCTAFINKHLQNKQIVLCVSDAMYIKPDYRSSIISGRLIKAVEKEAKRRGAAQMVWVAKEHSTFHKALVKRTHLVSEVMVTKEL